MPLEKDRKFMQARPLRSALYMPASNARALEKARDLDVDAVIFDLEDAVSPDAKPEARQQAARAVREGGYGRRQVVVRINGLGTPWGADDLEAAVAAAPDAILVPKVGHPDDLAAPQAAIAAAGSSSHLWAMIETPAAFGNLYAIAGATGDALPALSAFVIGTNDLVKDMRMRVQPARANLVPMLVACVAAARTYGLQIVDGVYNALEDPAGFEAECIQGRDLGMDGKSLIHPRQAGPCNAAFRPTAEEIARARLLVELFDRAENSNANVLRVDGQMVERLHADAARQMLSLWEAVTA
jgi:citrate lyase subunit beta/citryl-CoA lyase